MRSAVDRGMVAVVGSRPHSSFLRWIGAPRCGREVLLAENHSEVASELMRLLSSDFEVVAVVASGEDLIEEARKLSPDAVLADVGLDGLDAISATLEIRQRFPTIPIVLVTSGDVDSRWHTAIAAGASALLPKTDPEVFMDMLHQLLRRRSRREGQTSTHE